MLLIKTIKMYVFQLMFTYAYINRDVTEFNKVSVFS